MVRPILRASLIVLAAAACSDMNGGGGRTQVLLTDSPFPYDSVDAVNIYVARIDVSTSSDTSGVDPAAWITVATPERAFNLLSLQNGASALLGESDLPAAQYAAVRMVINTSRSGIVLAGGQPADVQWPMSGELMLYALVEHPLTITTETGGHIVIDFDVGRSFLLLGSVGAGSFQFLPWIRAVNDAATGEIRGTVSMDLESFAALRLENTAIEVYRGSSGSWLGGSLVATGHTDAQGRFVIPLLAGGDSYRVDAYPPDYPWLRASVSGVTVTIGQSTTVNLHVGPDSTGGPCCDSLPPPPDTIVPPPGTGPADHITMTPATQTVNVGDSISVLAVAKDSLDRVVASQVFTWSVGDPTVVSTTWQGGGWILLRALKSGSSTVTATDTLNTSISGTATVTVR